MGPRRRRGGVDHPADRLPARRLDRLVQTGRTAGGLRTRRTGRRLLLRPDPLRLRRLLRGEASSPDRRRGTVVELEGRRLGAADHLARGMRMQRRRRVQPQIVDLGEQPPHRLVTRETAVEEHVDEAVGSAWRCHRRRRTGLGRRAHRRASTRVGDGRGSASVLGWSKTRRRAATSPSVSVCASSGRKSSVSGNELTRPAYPPARQPFRRAPPVIASGAGLPTR